MYMEVKSANSSLRMNRAAASVDNSGSDQKERHPVSGVEAKSGAGNSEGAQQSVMLSISAAGLRRSLLLERQVQKNSQEAELEEMMKKMEGLSSQVINGHFSITDRLNFNHEISNLTAQLNKMRDNGEAVTKEECGLLSQKISDLTKIINDAAVYRKNASTVFVVNSKPKTKYEKATLDIAL